LEFPRVLAVRDEPKRECGFRESRLEKGRSRRGFNLPYRSVFAPRRATGTPKLVVVTTALEKKHEGKDKKEKPWKMGRTTSSEKPAICSS